MVNTKSSVGVSLAGAGTRPWMFAVIAGVIVLLLIAAGCGGGDDTTPAIVGSGDEVSATDQASNTGASDSEVTESSDVAAQPDAAKGSDDNDEGDGAASAALDTRVPSLAVVTEVVDFNKIYDTAASECGTANEGEEPDCYEYVEEIFGEEEGGIVLSLDAIWVVVDDRDEVVRVGLDTLTVTDRIEVAEGPSGLAVSADAIWVANKGAGIVSRIDLETRMVIDEIDVACDPTYVAVSDDAVWVGSKYCEGSAGVVSRIDLATSAVTDTIEIDKLRAVAAGPDAIWVAERDGQVLRIDPATRTVTDTIEVGYFARGISLADDSVWVLSATDEAALREMVLRIDIETLAITDTIEFDNADVIAVGGGAVWVGGEHDDRIARIDLETRTVIDEIEFGSEPGEIAVGDGAVWVLDHDNNILRRFGGREPSAGDAAIDMAVPSPATVMDIVDFNEFYETARDCASAEGAEDDGCDGVGNLFRSQLGIAFSSDAIWLAVEDEKQAAEIWLKTLGVTDKIEVDGSPSGLAVAAGAVWVANTDDDTILRIDLETRSATDTIEVGHNPWDIAASSDALWVADDEGTVVRIDLESRAVTDTIEVGKHNIRHADLAVSGDAVWVANGYLWRIDLETRAVSDPISLTYTLPPEFGGLEVDYRPEAVAVSGEAVWVVEAGGAVLRIDPESRVVTDVIDFENPEDLAVSDDAVWVADRGANTVSRIDLETRTVVEVIPVDEYPGAIAVGAGSVWVVSLEENTVSRIG